MMESKQENNTLRYIDLGMDHLHIKSSTTVRLTEEFYLSTDEGSITLNVFIQTDLAKIPEKYHEVFLNMLTAKYLNKVSFSDNPFSECKKNQVKPWYLKMWEKITN